MTPEASYFDTADLRLTRAGASLRFRPGEGWTVELPAGRDGGVGERHERRFSGEPGRPPAPAAELVRALARTAALEPVGGVRSPGSNALGPPDVDASPEPGADTGTGDAIRAALARSVARLVEHDPGIRLGEDPEAVHQARVATRRLRSDLQTFGPLLDADWAGSLRDELAWLAAALGAVRDAEVLLDRLRRRSERLPGDEAGVAGRALRGLAEQRAGARAALLETLRGRRYARLLDRLVEASREPPVCAAADRPATLVLPRLVRKPWKRLARAVDGLGDDPTDKGLHEVRKAAKRARYACEAVAPVAGAGARRLARALEKVQDVLGEHQDAVVAQAWLRDAAATAAAPEAFALGQLVATERAAAEAARATWRKTWPAASRKKLRAWL